MAQTSQYVERTKMSLKLKDIKKDYKRWYYVVEYNGQDYELKMFDFQKTESRPDTIECLIERKINGRPEVKQDLAPLIARRYPVGKTAKFTLRRDFARGGQYDAISEEGFKFYLSNQKNKYYANNSEVKCKVLLVEEVKVLVAEAETSKNEKDDLTKFIAPQGILDIANGININPSVLRWAVNIFGHNVDFAEARMLLEENSPYWIVKAIDVILSHMPEWLNGLRCSKQKKDVLHELRRVCIATLEQSGLVSGADKIAEILRQKLAECVTSTDEFNAAIEKLDDGTICQYVQGIINSLSQTAYIYDSGRRLDVLMAAFALDSDLMGEFFPQLLETLAKRGIADWKQEPIRSSLLHMLCEYIEVNTPKVNKIIDKELSDNKRKADDMMKALLAVLLLSDGNDDINRRLLFARLCRYSTLYEPNAEKRQSLNDKAYGFLLTHVPSQLLFGWNDMKFYAGTLGVKVGAAQLLLGPSKVVCYEGRQTIVKIHEGNVTIMPNSGDKLREVLPVGLCGWKNFQIFLGNKNFNKTVKADTDDITDLRKFWREVEDCLFCVNNESSQTAESPAALKMAAEEGDEVFIRISGVEPGGNSLFHAIIVDERIEGEGVISTRDIVHYNVKNAKVTDFMSENGCPLLLSATVTKVDSKGFCEFSMTKQVEDFVSRYAQEGDEVLCRMTIKTSDGGNLLISEKGYSLKVDYDEDFQPANGDLVRVEIITVYDDGRVDGAFIGTPDSYVDMPDSKCFRNLLREYSEYEYVEENEEGDAQSEEDADFVQDGGDVDSDELRELMSIIERQSTLVTSRAQSFNLLAMARIIALAMDDLRKANEYHDRMIFIHLLQQYAVNQWIDADEFESHYDNSKDLLEDYPDMMDQVLRLFCISRMDKANSEAELVDVIERRRGSLTADVASLVIAYNALKPHNLEAERRGIKNKINELLHVETRDVSDLVFIGDEGPQLELKSSLVFPPDNNMRPDREKQCHKLLTVVCGMMNNSLSASLKVGVNDSGLAAGLDNDFRELAGSSNYDERKCRDMMDTFFSNMMQKHMTKGASTFVKTHFEDHNGRTVYVVDVEPASFVVRVDDKCYRRVGSTTRLINDEEVRMIEEIKKDKRA